MPIVYKDVEVEVDIELDDFDDDDLREECIRRNIIDGMEPTAQEIALLNIAQHLQLGQKDLAMRKLEELIYDSTGRIVVLT